MKKWMVRRTDFSLIRPVPEKELIRKIESGELLAEDEICSNLGYWFFLHETNEVRKFLGDIKLDRLNGQHEDDVTSETATEKTLGKTKALTPLASLEPIQIQNALKRPVSATPVRPIPIAVPDAVLSHSPEPRSILKAVIFVLILFSAFIFVLISFWLSTY